MISIMPNGTITLWGDRGMSELYLYCDQDPDPTDWEIALEVATQYSDGEPPDEFMDGEVVVFVYRLGGEEQDLADRQGRGGGEMPASRGRRQRLLTLTALRGLFYRPQHKSDALSGASP